MALSPKGLLLQHHNLRPPILEPAILSGIWGDRLAACISLRDQTLGSDTVVFVRTGQGFRAQPVQVGSRSGGMVAITGGLAAGTQIATTNAFLLKAEIEKESAE